MNCSDWEERIALHAGGDLPPAEAAEVERHLRECAGCQMLASGLKQSLALLKEAHDEPLAPAHFSAVRARVVAKLEQKQPLWRRAWSFGLAAAVVALLVMLTMRPAQRLRQPRTLEAVKESSYAGGTACATTTSPACSEVGQAVPPASPASGRFFHASLESSTGPHHSPPHRRVARRVARPAVPDAPNPEPLIVKLQTDDPNVVIYWIADRRKGE